jgi:putative transposase
MASIMKLIEPHQADMQHLVQTQCVASLSIIKTMEKYQNKYRIPSARLQGWDYGAEALYFVTICTQNRIHYFGEIANQQMQLSKIGEIVESEWLRTFELRPDMNLYNGEFVVMPNHFHAIVGIGKNEYNTHRRDAMHCVSTNATSNQFGPQSKNLASIVRGFKSSVTIATRMIIPQFQWQARFYDHIIRNHQSFQNISNYIMNNPQQWEKDKFYAS